MRLKYLFVLLVLVFINSAAVAQCLEGIEGADDVEGYRDRGGYCEGYISTNVTGGDISLVQYTIEDFSYDLKKNQILFMRAGVATSQPVKISVVGKETNLLYRLDGLVSASSFLEWDLNQVVKKKNLPASMLGAYGTLEVKERRASRPVFVPVMVSNTAQVLIGGKKRKIVLRPGAAMVEIRWRLKENGRPLFPTQTIPLKGNSFIAKEQPVTIVIPEKFEDPNGQKKKLAEGKKYSLEVAYLKRGAEKFQVERFDIIF